MKSTFTQVAGILVAAGALAVPALGVTGSSEPASIRAFPTGNLLQNPGAEAAPGAKNYEAVAIPGWQKTAEFTAVTYKPKALDLPSTEDSARLRGGANFFAGGNAAATASATQTVSVASDGAIIDAGAVLAKLSALIGGSRAQEDHGIVEAVFLDAAGAELAKFAIGPVTAEERQRVTKLLPKEKTARVPPKTRAIRVTMTAIRVHGSYNEAIFDNLSLTLAEQPQPRSALTAVSSCAGKRKSLTATVKATGGLVIRSVTFSVKGSPEVRDVSAPFAARLPLSGRAKRVPVTAQVADAAGRVTTLTKAVKNCA